MATANRAERDDRLQGRENGHSAKYELLKVGQSRRLQYEILNAAADKIMAALSTKNRVLLDPDDPLFLLVTLFREVQKETLTQLTKVVADATDKSAAVATASEAAARAKAESIVSQAGEWAGAKIREAGDLVLSRIQAEMQTAGRRAEMAARRAMRAAYIIGFAGLCLVAGVTGWLGVFLRWW